MLILVFQRKSFPQILRHQYWNFKNNSNWHSHTVTFRLSVPLYHPLNLSLSLFSLSISLYCLFYLSLKLLSCVSVLLKYLSLLVLYNSIVCMGVLLHHLLSLFPYNIMVDCLYFSLSLSSSLSLYCTLYMGMSLCP